MLRNALLAGLVLAGAAHAQCSNLTASINAGEVTLAMTGGGAMAFTVYLIGDTTGATSIHLGIFGTLELGLAAPFVPAPNGFTDGNGDNTLTFPTPSNVTGTYYAQALTVGFEVVPGTGVSLDFCASNVATINL